MTDPISQQNAIAQLQGWGLLVQKNREAQDKADWDAIVGLDEARSKMEGVVIRTAVNSTKKFKKA
jgi:hypothetical protein